MNDFKTYMYIFPQVKLNTELSHPYINFSLIHFFTIQNILYLKYKIILISSCEINALIAFGELYTLHIYVNLHDYRLFFFTGFT